MEKERPWFRGSRTHGKVQDRILNLVVANVSSTKAHGPEKTAVATAPDFYNCSVIYN